MRLLCCCSMKQVPPAVNRSSIEMPRRLELLSGTNFEASFGVSRRNFGVNLILGTTLEPPFFASCSTDSEAEFYTRLKTYFYARLYSNEKTLSALVKST